MSDTAVGDIKARLVENIDALAAELLPGGRRHGAYFKALCPWRADSNVGSFWVNLHGPMRGTYHDAATGETGDALTLIAKVQGLDPRADFRAVLAWARGWLGLDGAAAVSVRRPVRPLAEQAERERQASAKAEKNRRRALACYLEAKKAPFVGSPADVYLKGRGIDVTRLGRMPGVLGWLPEHRHAESGTRWPAMVAGFTSGDGAIIAVHRTWVTADGSAKAPVEPVRKIWPGFGGAAIRLWRGGSAMDVKAAAACGLRETLVLVEGVEDGLSVALALPDLRVWCAGSLGNLARIVLPECCDAVVVCADNDWGKPQAQRQFDGAIAALAAQGRPIQIARSHIGKDVNDALRG